MASTVPGLDDAFAVLRKHGHTIGQSMVDADGVVKTRVDDAYLTPGEIKGLAKDVASNAETT
jgi:hypothetical protein